MQVLNFEQKIFIDKIDLDHSFYEECNSINFLENEEQFSSYQNLDDKIRKKNNFFFSYLEPFFLKSGKILGFKGFKVLDFWFQKYTKPNMHIGTHVHNTGKYDYSFVLYIDCSEHSADTVFHMPGYPYIDIDTIRVKPLKKVCVLFPGYLPHYSKPNNDDKRFIMSGNIKFIDEAKLNI